MIGALLLSSLFILLYSLPFYLLSTFFLFFCPPVDQLLARHFVFIFLNSVKTGTELNKGASSKRLRWEKGDISLLNCVTAQVVWYFRVLENHLLNRKMIASKYWLEGGILELRPSVYCILLWCSNFMEVLYCIILVKLDLRWGTRRSGGCWRNTQLYLEWSNPLFCDVGFGFWCNFLQCIVQLYKATH